MIDEPLRLDFGCGKNKRPGFQGCDRIAFDGVDHVFDIGKERWPFKDGSVTEAHASHFIEHLTASERIHFVNELYRVLIPGGTCQLIAPHWASNRAYGDPTHCYADDTEILTSSGWMPIDDVEVGDFVFALDADTEVTHLVGVIDKINQPYVGKMLQFKTNRMDLLVTPNHEMLWRSKQGNPDYWKRRGKEEPRSALRKSAAETFLSMGGHHPRRAIAVMPDWDGANPTTIRVADDVTYNGRTTSGEFDAAALSEFMGWYVSEGYVDNSDGSHWRVNICQKQAVNAEKYDEIVNVIRRLGVSPTLKHDRIQFSSVTLGPYLKRLGLCDHKFIPAEFKGLSKKHLGLLLKAAIKGDGRKNGTRGWEYASTSERLADDIQEIAVKMGYRTSMRREARSGIEAIINGRTVTAKKDIFFVGIAPATDAWYPIPKPVTYSGRVVCVTLPKFNNVYVRRNGFAIWSGNSWPPLAEMWFYYLDKAWRAANAPHTDAEHFPNNGFACDFTATWGYSMHNALLTRNTEYQQHALGFWKEAAQDIIATLTKK